MALPVVDVKSPKLNVTPLLPDSVQVPFGVVWCGVV